MNIWDHSRLSVRKFGGKEIDYYEIHKFIDSSKLFIYNPKHRLLLHNLWGIEITVEKFSDIVLNSDNREILVRDIAAEHCKEDLDGRVPSLNDWLKENNENLLNKVNQPLNLSIELEEFVLRPMLRSNLKSALMITTSNFGVYLVKELLGLELSKELYKNINQNFTIQDYLLEFKFTQKWQFTPQKKEIEWLKLNK